MAKVNISQYIRQELSKDENNVNKMRDLFNEVKSLLSENKVCERVLGNFSTFYPSIQYIILDALQEKDVPHNIQENSIRIEFKIDLLEKKVEATRWGHVYLSEQESKETYLVMCSMKNIAEARGVKWFRKQGFKDAKDLQKKMNAFYIAVMEKVNDYTNGYPYKQGIGYVNPNRNIKAA